MIKGVIGENFMICQSGRERRARIQALTLFCLLSVMLLHIKRTLLGRRSTQEGEEQNIFPSHTTFTIFDLVCICEYSQ